MNVQLSALSMKTEAYVITNPLEITNNYTKKNVDDAVQALDVTNKFSMDELKKLLQEYDFTSVSTNELTKVGYVLYKNDMIDIHMYDFLSLGNMAFDERGHKAEVDVRFNAVAMFNQLLEERKVIGKTEFATSFHEITRALGRVNHVLGALSFFANSDTNDLSISVKA